MNKNLRVSLWECWTFWDNLLRSNFVQNGVDIGPKNHKSLENHHSRSEINKDGNQIWIDSGFLDIAAALLLMPAWSSLSSRCVSWLMRFILPARSGKREGGGNIMESRSSAGRLDTCPPSKHRARGRGGSSHKRVFTCSFLLLSPIL